MMTMMLKAKMRLRLVKGMRLAMEAVDLLLRMGGTKALVATSEATMTKAVMEPRSRYGISADRDGSLVPENIVTKRGYRPGGGNC